jgi:LPPG:FO 2-phospho-L-lactate transferase
MNDQVVALCGGIGGAKLALGLSHIVDPERLSIIVNTGDDFEHLGLNISPDLDTVVYTLSDLADRARGWGRADETWHFMEALRELGGPGWFQLGDRDLAMNVERTRALRSGVTLSSFVARAARALGIRARILPMTDDPVQTVVETEDGRLGFQQYFVERRCAPVVRALHFAGADLAAPAPGVLEALSAPSLRAVVICPSNPYLSIDPILAVAGIRAGVMNAAAPVVAISPIIGGDAIKGPTVKIMSELGIAPTTASIAAHYHDLLDGLVIDDADADDAASLDVSVYTTRTLMNDLPDRIRLAKETLAFAETLSPGRRELAAQATATERRRTS